jgi:hypothetical protein
MFYSPLLGVNLQARWECPLCPYITPGVRVALNGSLMAAERHPFLHRVLAIGTENALLFLGTGWLMLRATRLVRRGGLQRGRRNEDL